VPLFKIPAKQMEFLIGGDFCDGKAPQNGFFRVEIALIAGFLRLKSEPLQVFLLMLN